MTILYSEDVFPSGKHNRKTVKETFNIDPDYVKNFNSNLQGSGERVSFRNNICISDETLNILQNDSIQEQISTRKQN